MTRLEDANKANLGLSKQPVLGKRYKTLQKYRLISRSTTRQTSPDLPAEMISPQT